MLASAILGDAASDRTGRYVHGEVVRLLHVIQIARFVEGGNWHNALSEIDRLRLREPGDPRILALVQRAEQLREADWLGNAASRARPSNNGRTGSAHPVDRPAQGEWPDERDNERPTRPDCSRHPRFPLSLTVPGASTPPARISPHPPAPLPAVPMQEAAGRPARRGLWLGIAALALLIVGGFVGTRFFGIGSSGRHRADGDGRGDRRRRPGDVCPATPVPKAAQAVAPPASQPTSGRARHDGPVGPDRASPAGLGCATDASAQPSAAPGSAPQAAVPSAPPLATARYLHTATRLDDGKILVAGGEMESRRWTHPSCTTPLPTPGSRRQR